MLVGNLYDGSGSQEKVLILLDVLHHSKKVDLDAPAVNVSSAHGPVGHPWEECDYVTHALQRTEPQTGSSLQDQMLRLPGHLYW